MKYKTQIGTELWTKLRGKMNYTPSVCVRVCWSNAAGYIAAQVRSSDGAGLSELTHSISSAMDNVQQYITALNIHNLHTPR